MPLRTPSPAATSAADPSTEIVSRSNSGPATAATSSSSVVAGSSLRRRWLTTSRTLSGLDSWSIDRTMWSRPPAVSTAPDSTSIRHSSETRNGLPWVRSPTAAATATSSSSRSQPEARSTNSVVSRGSSPEIRRRVTASERRRSASRSPSGVLSAASDSR